MEHSKLYIICGSCGCDDELVFEIDPKGRDVTNDVCSEFEPVVFIHCDNCGTLHDLSDFIKERPL